MLQLIYIATLQAITLCSEEGLHGHMRLATVAIHAADYSDITILLTDQ